MQYTENVLFVKMKNFTGFLFLLKTYIVGTL